MQKFFIGYLISTFMFLQGYSQQTDSLQTGLRDSIPPANSISSTNYNAVELSGSNPVYKLKPAVDIPIVAVGTAWSLYAFTKIYNKPPSTVEQIENLKISNINVFDRWAVYPYSQSLDKISY